MGLGTGPGQAKKRNKWGKCCFHIKLGKRRNITSREPKRNMEELEICQDRVKGGDNVSRLLKLVREQGAKWRKMGKTNSDWKKNEAHRVKKQSERGKVVAPRKRALTRKEECVLRKSKKEKRG